jgi:GTP pyrophosphokinase
LELFRDEVFVFTPKHDVIDLPAGATPIDFAYRIHTEVGHRCVGARVNGRMVSLDYEFSNGDICEVLTSSTPRPSPDWLRVAKTSGAKSKIRRFLRQQHRQANVDRGRELLERELARLQHRDRDGIDLDARLADLAEQLNYRETDDLYAAIGYGDLDPESAVARLRAKPEKPETLLAEAELLLPLGVEAARPTGPRVSAGGVAGFHTRLSRCCSPLPGDAILGYVTRGRGLAIHRADCQNIAHHARREPSRVVDLTWTNDGEATYQADLQLDAIDRVGLLADISSLVGETQINIASAHVRTDASHRTARIHLTLDIRHRDELNALIRRLDSIPDVMHVRVGPPPEP